MSPDTDPTTKDQTKDAVNKVAGQATGGASDVVQTAKAEVRSVKADAKDQAANVLHQSRSELRDRAGEQTRALSSTLGNLADQLGAMADGSDDPEAPVARLAKSAADQLQDRAQRLDDGGFDGMMTDLKQFARNRPGAFLFGSVAAGFAIGRLAKHADLQQAGDHAKRAASPDGDADDDRSALSSEASHTGNAPPATLGAGTGQSWSGIEGAATGAGSAIAAPPIGGRS